MIAAVQKIDNMKDLKTPELKTAPIVAAANITNRICFRPKLAALSFIQISMGLQKGLQIGWQLYSEVVNPNV